MILLKIAPAPTEQERVWLAEIFNLYQCAVSFTEMGLASVLPRSGFNLSKLTALLENDGFSVTLMRT